MKQIWKERQGKQPPGHDPLLSALDLNWTLLPKPSMIFHRHFLPDCNSLKIDEYKRAGPLTGAGTRVKKKKSCLSLSQWPSEPDASSPSEPQPSVTSCASGGPFKGAHKNPIEKRLGKASQISPQV